MTILSKLDGVSWQQILHQISQPIKKNFTLYLALDIERIVGGKHLLEIVGP